MTAQSEYVPIGFSVLVDAFKTLTDMFALIQIWSTSSLSPLYVIHPHGETDAGDIYSLAFSYTPADPSNSSAEKAILFFGCQNTSLQWIDLSSTKLYPPAPQPTTAVGGLIQPKPTRLIAVSGSATESSSEYELEYELEFEFEGEDEDYIDHTVDDADDELQHVQDENNSVSSPNLSHLASRLNPPRRPSPRPPKKLHKFFDSQPRGSQNNIPTVATLSTSPSSSAVNDAHSYSIPRNTSFSSIGSIERSGSSLKTTQDSSVRRVITASNAKSTKRSHRPRVLRVSSANVVDSAHYGYVYCMAIVPAPVAGAQLRPFGSYEPELRFQSTSNARENGEIHFVSGSGDEDVKVCLTCFTDIMASWKGQ